MKKKFENFLKQLGDNSKKKRNISANVIGISGVSMPFRARNLGERIFYSYYNL